VNHSRRVLVVTTMAGTVRAFLLPHIRRLQAQGFEVDVACNARSRSAKEVTEDEHIPLHDLPLQRRPLAPGNLRALWRLVRLIRRRGYDIVHVHTPVAGLIGRLAARLADARVRTIYTAHGFHFHKGQTLLKSLPLVVCEKLAGRWTDYLVVINREDEAAAKRYRLVPQDRLRYVPGVGVDLEAFHPGKIEEDEVVRVRQELGLAAEESLFVIAAEFNPGKRHADALRAFAKLGREDAHLALAGAGRLQQEMAALAVRLGVAERVYFLGFRRDLPALMRASVATVLPSEREGLSRTVLESLALEVPVIGADARGIRDLVGDDAGILVPVGDVAALSRALTWVLQHPEEAKAMGGRGRVKMQEFALRRVLELLDRLYAEALG